MNYKFIIKGRPITKKNSQIRTKTGVIQSKQYREYESIAIPELVAQKSKQGLKKPLACPVIMSCKYHMPNKQGYPDLMGLIQATADILEKAGVLENDRLVSIIENSFIDQISKENPRAEIKISEITDTSWIQYYQDPYCSKKMQNGEYEYLKEKREKLDVFI